MSSARIDWIDCARAVKIETVLRERGIIKSLKGRNGQFAGPCCPNCGGRDRFGVNLKRNLFNCRHCGTGGGDAIALVCFLDGCDFMRAVEILAGPPPDGRSETEQERHTREQQANERRKRLERERIEQVRREATELKNTLRYCDVLWKETVALPPAAIAYFAERKIDINAVPDQGGLRFHATCPFDGRTLPCVLGRFTDPVNNMPGGIWRRPLSGEKPKSLGPIKDHVIRLWPDEYVEQGLVIGEGVETTIAAALSITHQGTLLQPAWAAGSADNLKSFPVLNRIEAITVLADNDESGTGQDAARACAKRWADAGIEAQVLTTRALGTDFNDLILEDRDDE